MTNLEFLNEFDILYNSITSNQAPGLDAYEKSALLTTYQETLVRSLYNGNITGQSFEETEEMRRSLDVLIQQASIPSTTSNKYSLPDEVMFIIQEEVIVDKNKDCKNITIPVVPVRYDEWNRIKSNPFKGPNERRVIRLDIGKKRVELKSIYPIQFYKVSYIRYPRPIILERLTGELSINNSKDESTCELDDSLHRIILEGAVRLAASIYKNT